MYISRLLAFQKKTGEPQRETDMSSLIKKSIYNKRHSLCDRGCEKKHFAINLITG